MPKPSLLLDRRVSSVQFWREPDGTFKASVTVHMRTFSRGGSSSISEAYHASYAAIFGADGELSVKEE